MSRVVPYGGKCSGDAGLYDIFWQPERSEAASQNKLYNLLFEITNKCFGSCAYCFSASDEKQSLYLPRDKVISILNEVYDMGVRVIFWSGGDPLLHPDWFEFASYAKDKGFNNHILPSLLITRKQARQIAQLGAEVLIHIDTINQDDYNQVHYNPKTLSKKIQGYKYLLEEGVPPERCWVCITFTKAAAAHIEETIDWYVDEMRAKWINFAVFKTEGFGRRDQDFEPSKSDLERALRYRAKKFQDESTLRFGTSDAGMDLCRTYFVIKYDGRVTPCPMLSDLSVGNISTEGIREIYEKHKDELTFNFKVKGYCGEKCPDRDICFGCRAIAYHYVGDVSASDPKCWKNPDNPEYVFG